MAGQANPEINALFDEWAIEVEKEVLAAISQQGGKANPVEIAKTLKISEDSVLYFISRLIKDKKIKVTSVEII
jgi:predicted transcriptional regulator